VARWQEFENLAERILAELQPMAEVSHNDFIYGHLTETNRQIDVSIRWTSDNDQYLTIVQAKDHGRPADIKVVDEFLSVIKDVRATGGILICRSGFTGTAHNYARNSGVALLNLHDAQSVNWSLQLTVPIIWIELTPRVSIRHEVYLELGDSIPTDDRLGAPMTNDDGKTRINPVSTFEKYWNGPAASRELSVEHHLPLPKDPIQAIVRDPDGAIQLRPVRDFSVSYTVEQTAWLGRFQPAECRGLIDYLDEKAFTVSYLPLSEIPVQRDGQWQKIDDPAEVVVSLRGTVITTARIIVVQGSQVQELKITYLGPDVPEQKPQP
jgi:hypothetical protein